MVGCGNSDYRWLWRRISGHFRGKNFYVLHTDDASWSEFDKILNNVSDKEEDWKIASGWKEKIENSNRSFFDVSTGFAISVLIKYEEAQKLDAKSTDHQYPLAEKLKEVSEKLLEELNLQFST